jgi:hypothetical protein
MAVGKERFREDASKLMGFLSSMQMQQLESDDPLAGYMLQVGGRRAAGELGGCARRGLLLCGGAAACQGPAPIWGRLVRRLRAAASPCPCPLTGGRPCSNPHHKPPHARPSTPSCVPQAGARLCKCLGEEFLPYLPIVMPSLLKSAQIDPDIKVRRTAA